MKFKKSILTSLLLGSMYATSASATLGCEEFPSSMFCEVIVPNQQMNTYSWNASGALYMQSGNSSFLGTLGCSAQGYGTVSVVMTLPNGTSQTYSHTKYCYGGGIGYGYVGGSGGGSGGGGE